MNKELPKGTKVKFNIAQGLCTGEAIITDIHIDPDDGHFYYKLDNIIGNQCNEHKNEKGELWLNDFEVCEGVK